MENDVENMLSNSDHTIHTMYTPRTRGRQQFSLGISSAPAEETEDINTLQGILNIVIIVIRIIRIIIVIRIINKLYIFILNYIFNVIIIIKYTFNKFSISLNCNIINNIVKL